jgi:hypothetical protein
VNRPLYFVLGPGSPYARDPDRAAVSGTFFISFLRPPKTLHTRAIKRLGPSAQGSSATYRRVPLAGRFFGFGRLRREATDNCLAVAAI